MSVFMGRKFESSVIITYSNTFQAKTHTESDNIHKFTEISISLLFKVEFAQGNFKLLTLSHNSHISHTTHNCFSTVHTYLTSVLGSEQIIALFRSLGPICTPKCYTHAPIISGICHLNSDNN